MPHPNRNLFTALLGIALTIIPSAAQRGGRGGRVWSGEIGLGAGDVAGSGDYGPTETGTGLVLDLEKQLHAVQAEYKSLLDKDVAAHNNRLQAAEWLRCRPQVRLCRQCGRAGAAGEIRGIEAGRIGAEIAALSDYCAGGPAGPPGLRSLLRPN